MNRDRSIAARANYLAQDTVDIQFAVEEFCRKMTEPEMVDWPAIQWLARYLKGASRVRVLFEFQDNQNFIDVWTDTEFWGCTKTRKSTSGRVIMIWTHFT